MKTLYTFLLLSISVTAFGQAPFLNIITEEVTIAEPAATDLETSLGAPAHTVRVYANIPDNYELQVVYGNSMNPLNLDAANGFYQDAIGGPTTLDINTALFGTFPTLEYDSWFTVGYESQSGNTLLVLPFDQAFFNTWETGSNLLVNDLIGGSVSVTALSTTFPPNTPDVNGNVLIGQFTSTGTISGCLNIQIRKLNPDGTVFIPVETTVFNNVCFEYTPEEPCTGDFDLNGIVNTPDLLLFMADFGCTSGCTKDLTNDDVVATPDLLVLLGVFGNTCP